MAARTTAARRGGVRAPAAAAARAPARAAVVARAAEEGGAKAKGLGEKLTAATLAALVATAPVSGAALASEFDVLATPVPQDGAQYLIDDGDLLNKVSRRSLPKKLQELEKATGFHLTVVTLKKLQVSPDAFSFSDKVLENWYPTAEIGDKKGVFLLVGGSKEGALSGGPAFMKTLGEGLLEEIITEDIPTYLEPDLKFNGAASGSVARISAQLQGKEVPNGPKAPKARNTNRTYKTKSETKRGNYGAVLIALLTIATVVPMVQYWSYVREE